MSYLKLPVDRCYNLFVPKQELSQEFLDAQWDSYCGIQPSKKQWLNPVYREGYEEYCSGEQAEQLNKKYDVI